MTDLSRRALLTGAASAAIVGSSVAGAALAATTAHPDADLIAAYAKFVAWDREYNFSPERHLQSNDGRDAGYIKWVSLNESVLSFRAKTAEGLAILALMALRENDVLAGVFDWDGYSRPPRLDDEGEWRDKILWALVESAREMAGGRGDE